MIPYGRQSIDQKDIDAVIKVLKSDFITQGSTTPEFEKKLARYCGAKYAVGVSHGTAALHLAYLAAGLKTGDEVITSPNSFVATTNMLVTLGAKPIFCDIRLDSYNIDESKIEPLITKKTKAIVPIHFAGQPSDMEKIIRLAKRHQLLVIEDAAHSLGAKYNQQRVGSFKTDMAIFSFHPVKPITTGEGGAIVTNNRNLYRRLILLRNHGIYKDKQGKNVMIELGYNYRMTDMAAALGLSQLKKINQFIKKRRQVVKWYQQELKGVKEIILPQELSRSYSGWHLYVIRTVKKSDRDKLMSYLKKNGVGANFHYPAIYAHPFYRKIGYRNLNLANEQVYQDSCITLPCYPQLKRSDVKYIADLIKKYFNKNEV